MHLRILSSVLLIKIFDFQGKKLKYRKDLLVNHSRKSLQNSKGVAGHVWVDLKLKSRTSSVT